MMVGQRRLKRLTLVFTLLSAILWGADLLIHSRLTCDGKAALALETQHIYTEKGAVQDISEWFSGELNKHFQSLTQPMCSPIKALAGSRDNYSLSQNDLQNNFDYFGALVALGNLRLADPQENNEAARQLTNVSKLFRDSGPAITSLSGSISSQQSALSLMQEQGVRLVSLANPQVSSQVTTGSVQSIVHVLEASNIQWLGLNAKRHHIAIVGGERVGVIAMCAGHRQCVESSTTPFAPIKYSPKVATAVVNEIKGHGVDVIVAMMSWGRDSGTYPDETTLTAARKLAQLGVNLIVGYNPNAVQDHAYFGSTLVIFSMGNLMSFETVTPYCWTKELNEWMFASTKDHCKIVHPSARENLRHREQHTRIYKIYLSRSQPAVAEYTTLPLTLDDDSTSTTYGLRTPAIIDNEWTTACGQSDSNCLSCKPL